ncbi:MAG TPA: ABC transporter substrate-binding protein [Stellaceae bacterium]|nr:ABC transporter substrate-binding protein [Stellaceae bacterium]
MTGARAKLCGTLLLVLAAFAGALPAHAADKVALSYVLASVEYADMLLAVDKGYFAEEGIDLQLEQAGGGVAVPALISGNIDFTGSGSVAISAILKGAKLKVLVVVDSHPAMQIWAQSAFKSFADLKGRPIGIISRGDTTEIAIRYYLAKHGLPEDYVSYTPLGPGAARFAAILSGSFPAALVNASEVADMRSAGKLGHLHRVVDLRRELDMAYNALATSDALIRSNPDLVRRMVRAILKGVRHVRASRADTIAALVRLGKTNTEADGIEYDALIGSISKTGTMPRKAQDFDIGLRAQMLGVAKDKVSAAGVFDFSFAEKANAELDAAHWQPKLGP